MLTGKELGAALKAAMAKKGVTQVALAAHFRIQQGSVSEWVRFGRIHKRHLPKLFAYFSDVCGPDHWGAPAGWDIGATEVSHTAMRLARAYDAASDEVKRLLEGALIGMKAPPMSVDVEIRPGGSEAPPTPEPAGHPEKPAA